ncbi:MAG TPA: flagellin [Bryobacteraceae bacterium]|nr:flagellin [Bryobacteraceae bacterium]
MVSGIDPSAAQFLADLAQTQARMNTAQRQVSSGLKFQDASDAPDQVSDILSLRADISRNTQVQSNLGNVKTQVDAAEQAVSNAEQLVEQARTLAAQGLTGTQTAQTRNALAQQVQAIHDQLISLANSQVGNWYVFGGDAPQSAPYAADTNNPDAGGGVVQQTTVQATRQIQDPLGNTFTVDLTAQQIFDDQNPDGTPTSNNVFVAINQLRVALQSNDVDAIQSSLDAVTQADDFLNNQLGFYGAAQNRVSAATNLAQNLALDYQTALSDKQDADLTQAITELNQTQIQEQATLQARAQMPRTSLFDYLRSGG